MGDLAYLRKRVGQEEQAARTATCVEAEMVHRAMAAEYARRALAVLVAQPPSLPMVEAAMGRTRRTRLR